jgi:hypothetical protein
LCMGNKPILKVDSKVVLHLFNFADLNDDNLNSVVRGLLSYCLIPAYGHLYLQAFTVST